MSYIRKELLDFLESTIGDANRPKEVREKIASLFKSIAKKDDHSLLKFVQMGGITLVCQLMIREKESVVKSELMEAIKSFFKFGKKCYLLYKKN